MIRLHEQSVLSLIQLIKSCYSSNVSRSKHSLRIILWNLLCNKYAEHSKVFSSLQTKNFCKTSEAFSAFCDVILGKGNVSFGNSMQ